MHPTHDEPAVFLIGGKIITGDPIAGARILIIIGARRLVPRYIQIPITVQPARVGEQVAVCILGQAQLDRPSSGAPCTVVNPP